MVEKVDSNELSIYEDIKDILGVPDDSFKESLLMFINGALDIMNQAGAGRPVLLTTETPWSDFQDPSQAKANENFNLVRSYVWLRCKVMFDPPSNPSTLSRLKELEDEYIWRVELAYSPATEEDALKGGENK